MFTSNEPKAGSFGTHQSGGNSSRGGKCRWIENKKSESAVFDMHPISPVVLSSHDSTPSDADVYEQLMLFVRSVRHIWRVISQQ